MQGVIDVLAARRVDRHYWQAAQVLSPPTPALPQAISDALVGGDGPPGRGQASEHGRREGLVGHLELVQKHLGLDGLEEEDATHNANRGGEI